MNYKFISFFISFIVLVSGIFAENSRENQTVVSVENLENSIQGRAFSKNAIYGGLITCAIQYDVGCFADVAQKYLDLKKDEILAQADEQVARASGNAAAVSKPSQIASTIEKLFSDLANLFKDGFSGFFSKDDEDEDLTKETKDADEETEEDDDDDDDDKKDDASRDVGASRKLKKKKKKGPIKKLFAAIKIGVLAAVVAIKISLLIKIFEAAMLFKIVLIGATAVIVQIVKLWLDYKNNKHHDSGIVYGGTPYSHDAIGGLSGAEWAGPGAPGEEFTGGDYHGRVDSDKSYAQNLAYNQYSENTKARKKKKKKKKKKKRLFAIFLAVVAKLGLLVKLVQTGLLLKLAITAALILAVSVAKFVYLIKHGKQKTIYYENSHHDHHYDHDDVYEHDDHHGWGRSAAGLIAYSKQIPQAMK